MAKASTVLRSNSAQSEAEFALYIKPLQPHGHEPRELCRALLAIALGTIIEWYDFTIYIQLSSYLMICFFPSSDPVTQSLSFWGVYALGYISRPVGSVVFGHIGDTRGRRLCLLLSVLLMGIPTVLIGCLPTYQHIGIAAPILLVLLRLVQGLAMGGEFGAAMVYLHEIAKPQHKALTPSMGYVGLGVGVVIGILVVTLMMQFTASEGAMLVWGWRVPFLLSVLTLAAAVLLRFNMPESFEFLLDHHLMEERYQQHQRQKWKVPDLPTGSAWSPSKSAKSWSAARAASFTSTYSQSTVATTRQGARGSQQQQQAQHYVPVAELLRNDWTGLVLQIGYEAWIAASFYAGYSWWPSFFQEHVGLSPHTTKWMVLSSMAIFTLVVPAAGYAADKGMPRMKASLAVFVVGAAVAIPVYLGFQTKRLAVCWLLQCGSLMLTAWTMGLLPCICSNIYPARVRISGVNLGYNVGMCLFGGLSPLVSTALQATKMHANMVFLGPGLWLLLTAFVSAFCSVLLLHAYPETDRRQPAELGPLDGKSWTWKDAGDGGGRA